MSKKLYIEGTKDGTNGNLDIAFGLLLEKELLGKMPRIILGNGRGTTVDNCCCQTLQKGETRFLLVDADSSVSGTREEYAASFAKKFNEQNPDRLFDFHDQNVFLMVQEVEAWLLSQPEVLDEFYGTDAFSKKMRGKKVQDINDPSDILSQWARNLNKNYHKVKHCCKLLPMLNTKKLSTDFDDFNKLLEVLKK